MTHGDHEGAVPRERVAAVILELCHRRGAEKTICPSEAARALAGKGGDWRNLMDLVRSVGGQLNHDGRIVIMQRGQPVDIATAKGPIRFGLAQS